MFRTRSQLPVEYPGAGPIFVNDFSLSPESLSDHDLLLRGYLAAGHDTRWINPKKNSPTSQARASPACLTFKPPKITTARSLRNLAEWNADISRSDDVFDLNKLEEFKNTDLDFLTARTAVKRSHSKESLQERASKQRKLDIASLRNVISQPHVLPSTMPVSTNKSSVAPYSKCKPIPIPPHSLPLPDPLPYTRRSWVIPVRGSLPWRHATSAVVLQDPGDLPEPPDPYTHEEIAWTAAALASLWSLLLLLRDKSPVGPLGLSFNVSSNVASDSQPTYSEISGMGAQPLTFDNGAAVSMVSSARPVPIPLTFIDHIKIYHDAVYSMQLRNLLDAWSFETGKAGAPKIRVLKGSRLVLLDERSKGIVVL
ncbi:hypothetical protein B0H14DRAFT_2626614 [Mycena olivaceomarginata]|nr:hypothetical protein B0H14DRAFT_2626614 [Mycena olivaceomarginata]